jgi:hypothetical protein
MSYSVCSCGIVIHLKKSSNALNGHFKRHRDHYEVRRLTYLPESKEVVT